MSTSASPLETSINALEICEHCAGEHEGSCSVDKTLLALSTNLRNSFQGTSRWSLSDTTAGLFKVYNLHALNCATDTFINGAQVNDRNELEEMLEWMRWSYAAYENDKQTLETNLELNKKDLVKMITNSGINKPAFFIGIHHLRKCVVLVIRGTNQKQDIFTDLCPHNKPFLQGSAHSGMLGAAKWLFENEGQTLQSLLVNNLGYRLVLTGHSLGAAIAGLLAMIIHATDGWFMPKETSGVSSSKILCWGYGCAPCVDRILAESSNFICNVVLQDDIVARVSPAAVEALRNEIQATSWSEVVQDERAKKVLETMGHIQGSILSTGAQAGAALFQTIDNLRTTYGPRLSTTSVIVYQPVEKVDSPTTNVEQASTATVAESIINNTPFTKDDVAEASDTGMVAQIGHIQGSILATGAHAGAALFQKIDNLRTTYGPRLSTTSAIAYQPVEKVGSRTTNGEQPSTATVAESIINNTKDDVAETSDTGMAAQTVMAVATGPCANMEELERRRLFVPGILYHIKRLRRHKEGRVSLPASPGKFMQAREEAFRSVESKYVVMRGMDPKERFGKIIVSKTMISDHSCPRYIRGLSLALSSCPNS